MEDNKMEDDQNGGAYGIAATRADRLVLTAPNLKMFVYISS